MNRGDIRNVQDALGLTAKALDTIAGLSARREVDPSESTLIIPQLGWDVLTELWRYTNEHMPDESRAYGIELAKALCIHGAGYAAWLVMNGRCSQMWRMEQSAEDGGAGRVP